MHIIPSTGRVLLFFCGPQDFRDGSLAVRSDDPMPVLACHDNKDGTANVGGFDHQGKPFHREAVPVLQDGDTIPTEVVQDGDQEGPYVAISRHCRWMDYQLAQAAKSANPPETVKGYVEPDMHLPVTLEEPKAEPEATTSEDHGTNEQNTAGSQEQQQ